MATPEVLEKVDILGPTPEKAYLDAKVEEIKRPADLPFDPKALKEKYIQERDKRLAMGGGLGQYRLADGHLSHFLIDPWVKPGSGEREPIETTCQVVIIGGGYGAQLVAVRLIEAGITDIKMIEKAGDFGGTWYWNRYPGAQCDIESYIYMPLLEELNYMPTEKYAHSKELLHHSEMIGKKYGLYERALFQTEVNSLRWDEDTKTWITKTNRGDTIRSKYVVPAAGPLHRPKLPGLPIEKFKGHSFHSARWDYNYTGGDNLGNLTGLSDKRVAIIGTGATAVQIVPHLGNWAKQVYVFQRTPSSIDVRGNRPTDPEWAKSLKKGWQKERMENFDIIVNGGIVEKDLVHDGWTDILHNLLARGKPSDDPVKAAADRQIADFEKMEQVRKRASDIVKDPETAESLKPWYNQLCKRPCFHDEYLQAFNKPNVKLVDTKGRGVEDITEKGVVANGKEFEVDCIIWATGFELATEYSHKTNMQIYGRGGMTFDEKWADGPCTLHGWTTRGFPNCFLISVVQAALSPNFLHVTGEQAEHLAYVISEAQKRGISTVEPTQEAEDKWVETIVTLAKLREPFLKECTPGYYNNEGMEANIKTARGATYGAGSPAFFKLLREWREKGDLEGLDLTYADK
ncbi:uncharacterized protein PV09_05208 [Verruconis gallopava]|uniref:FAD/NAD(P)-binding domain-containing protein n=1 Tax=Verruconis gallopava TaxID=253628 RepID=A0A0D2A9L7_9PEZI|nr:uncharacterized protein PV09_05208 [Verruconis gallopava]KIW03438.1 hypothetical protein PV09_05208 [Verruconis gallopava]